MKKLSIVVALLLAVAGFATTAAGVPQGNANYEVTIYNLSLDQPFSPPVLATHRAGVHLFAAGTVAGDALRMMAEDGLTVLAVLHDLPLAAHFFPRLVLLDEGRIVADGSSAEVLSPDRIREVYRVDPRFVPALA